MERQGISYNQRTFLYYDRKKRNRSDSSCTSSNKKEFECKGNLLYRQPVCSNQFRHKFLDWARENLHVENQDLWDAIFSEMLLHRKLRVSVKWIRSHQKDYNDPIVCGNFIADHMANYKNFKEYEKENHLQ